MSLNSVLAEVIKTVPDCVAAGYVDMTTGMLLGVKTVDSHPQEVLDLVAAATGDIFQGANVVSIEKLFKQLRGVDSDEHYFNEIIITSKNLIHVFSRSKSTGQQVLVTVSRAGANLGMMLIKSRQCLPQVEAAA